MSEMPSATALDEYPLAVVRRVEAPDLNQLGSWLIPRLTAMHPDATPQTVLSWLRGCVANNEIWLVCTDHACAMAQVLRVPLERQPIVVEVFCFVDSEEWVHEAADLYPRMASWAANHDASILELNSSCSDVSTKTIQNRIGKTQYKPRAWMAL